MRFSLIVAHLVDVSIPTTTNTRELLAERPGRISQASNRKFQTSSARHQTAGFKISESRFFAPRLGSAPACPGHGRNSHSDVQGPGSACIPCAGCAGNGDWGENDDNNCKNDALAITGYHFWTLANRYSNSRGTAETAAGLTVESSAENPKSDERTKREPGGKKFRTCSEFRAWLKKRRRSAT